MTSHARHPFLAHGFVPSVLGHAALLLGIAASGSRQPARVVLYDIDLEPLEAAASQVEQPLPSRPQLAAAAGEATVGDGPIGVSMTRPGAGTQTSPVAANAGPIGYVAPAAQAGRVLSAPDTSPVDFTMVQGENERYAGGVTMSRGTSETPVRDPSARNAGVAGVVGTTDSSTGAPGPAPATHTPTVRVRTKDMSRAPRPLTTSWSCPFPAEANAANVHFARVRIVVTVGVDGMATGAAVLGNPGYGFGPAAVRCALGQRYSAGLDPSGAPRPTTTAPITVTFVR